MISCTSVLLNVSGYTIWLKKLLLHKLHKRIKEGILCYKICPNDEFRMQTVIPKSSAFISWTAPTQLCIVCDEFNRMKTFACLVEMSSHIVKYLSRCFISYFTTLNDELPIKQNINGNPTARIPFLLKHFLFFIYGVLQN